MSLRHGNSRIQSLRCVCDKGETAAALATPSGNVDEVARIMLAKNAVSSKKTPHFVAPRSRRNPERVACIPGVARYRRKARWLSWHSSSSFLALGALWIATSFVLQGCSRSQREIIVIGDLSGEYAEIGHSLELGAEFARTELKTLPDGTSFIIRVINDKGNDRLARRHALEAIANPNVLAVVGHSTSGTTGAAIDLYGPQAMPLFLPVATSPDLTAVSKSRGWTNLFRLVPKDDLQASTIAEFCTNYLAARRVIVLNDDSRYGATLGESLLSALSNKDIEVPKHVVVQKFIEGKIDYGSYAKTAESYSADAFVFAGYYEEGGALISDLRAAGCYLPVVVTDGCFQSQIFENIGSNPANVYACFVAPDWSFVGTAQGLIQYKRVPQSDLTYAPFATDSIRIIDAMARSLLTSGERLNRKTLLTYMKDHREYPSHMIAGPYQFDSAGDNTRGQNYLYYLGYNAAGERNWLFIR